MPTLRVTTRPLSRFIETSQCDCGTFSSFELVSSFFRLQNILLLLPRILLHHIHCLVARRTMAAVVFSHALPVPSTSLVDPGRRFRRQRSALRCDIRRAATGGETGTSRGLDGDDTPDWAKDLALDENGDLIDTKTGKALNEFGATRFDLAVRAMRGEYDPPGVSTEQEEGQIFEMLTQFPCTYTFQASGRVAELDDDGITHVAGLLMDKCDAPLSQTKIEIKPRGKKFVSLWVTCTVHSAAMVNEALSAAKEDSRVMTIW